MHRGYIKLWRRSLDSPIWANPTLWRVWTYCLLKATYSERVGKVGYQDIPLQPGQFIFGRKKAAEETGLSEKNIRTAIDSLRKSENLAIKTASKYSIVTIVKWSEYQDEEAIKEATKRPATGQQLATDKKDNKDKKVKNYIIPFQEFPSVQLTEEEFNKLVVEFGKDGARNRCEKLYLYMGSTGKKYKSHYLTILNWERMNVVVKPQSRSDQIAPSEAFKDQ